MLLSPRPRPPSSFFPSVSFFRSIVLRRIEKAAGEQRGGIRVLRSFFSSLVPCSMYRSLLFLLNNAAFVGTNTMTKAAVEKGGREEGRKGRPPLGVLQAPSLFFLLLLLLLLLLFPKVPSKKKSFSERRASGATAVFFFFFLANAVIII